ncbi:MAG: gfo/Idh/MocA family oxidoreductase, partial [Firmicutes bacterium]|nr:gfo/Idh/MocA family oxidoreductase [Bacillota bacterium]
MNAAIIGCGLIGKKRANALKASGHKICAVSDLNFGRAQSLADSMGQDIRVTTDWNEIAACKDIDLVVISTTNDWLTPIGIKMVEAGKHVLIEKPAARNAAEIEKLQAAVRAKNGAVKVWVGFNLRFHPALAKAKLMVEEGLIGPVMFLRGRYGHGGRVGYDREWRADPDIAGGGELLDQGVHLIDLSRWFLGEIEQVSGFTHTYFWD